MENLRPGRIDIAPPQWDPTVQRVQGPKELHGKGQDDDCAQYIVVDGTRQPSPSSAASCQPAYLKPRSLNPAANPSPGQAKNMGFVFGFDRGLTATTGCAQRMGGAAAARPRERAAGVSEVASDSRYPSQ
jgi:hypothetical protein